MFWVGRRECRRRCFGCRRKCGATDVVCTKGARKRSGHRGEQTSKIDVEIVLEAVEQNGQALGHEVQTQKADREIMVEAVKQNGSAPRYAAPDHKADREIGLDVVKHNEIHYKMLHQSARRTARSCSKP